jgi:hypothetical protein
VGLRSKKATRQENPNRGDQTEWRASRREGVTTDSIQRQSSRPRSTGPSGSSLRHRRRAGGRELIGSAAAYIHPAELAYLRLRGSRASLATLKSRLAYHDVSSTRRDLESHPRYRIRAKRCLLSRCSGRHVSALLSRREILRVGSFRVCHWRSTERYRSFALSQREALFGTRQAPSAAQIAADDQARHRIRRSLKESWSSGSRL